VTHAAHALIIIFLLDDSWKLFLDVDLNEVDEHLDVDFLVHDREASVILVARLN
jgi:hypothetical protein